MVTLFRDGFTQLGGDLLSSMIGSEQCDTCKYYDSSCGFGDDTCTCPADPMCSFLACNVHVLGNPVRTKPSESTYQIQIWKTTALKSECGVDQLWTLAPVVTFSLSATVDPQDMEHQYAPFVKEYIELLKGIVPHPGKFSTLLHVPRESYVSDFKNRLDALLSTKDRPDTNENPHVGARPKKKTVKK